MKKANREDVGSNPMDRISELPKHILQRILYFLSQKDAVRTSVLSKSWRNIWCTRPNLDLSDINFKKFKQEFLSTVEKNLQRYCDRRMCLEEFGLRMFLGNHESVSLLEKWIPSLKNMGVKEFRLSIYWKYSRQLPSVVFEAESLQDLHVEGFMLDQTTIGRNVLSKHLKNLHLEKVDIEDGVFQKIISSCPLIETLSLESCERLRNIKVNTLLRLKKFYFESAPHEKCSIEIHPASLETIKIEFADVSFPKGIVQENLVQLVQAIKDENKPTVVLKKLIIRDDLPYFSPQLNGLFCICRPRTIGIVNYTNSESVLKNLMQGEGGNQDKLRQLWLPYLEEVSLEIYDWNEDEWDPTSLSDLPKYEEGKCISNTRFALKWRQNL
ncbi:PREDICTED: F-box/LRR-repeat protein 13-like [Erythranthe guttata]|uniref:F-box/LRR-repeat protein 13-like n=1 Tax=Erythranthe guttata TaxID=4155 RepID=UPI00064D8983|nr:PREDICTED: F-box/LRR-repeat protein 13-like [Erythranthe guttata]|eukprot:XP_012845988.1 PREDICTED: F-box/LRR-repeat protein 13-like [Erythranthe guttata]